MLSFSWSFHHRRSICFPINLYTFDGRKWLNLFVFFFLSLSLRVFTFAMLLSLSLEWRWRFHFQTFASSRRAFRFSNFSLCNNEVAYLWSEALPMLYGDLHLGHISIYLTRHLFLRRSRTSTRWFRYDEQKSIKFSLWRRSEKRFSCSCLQLLDSCCSVRCSLGLFWLSIQDSHE